MNSQHNKNLLQFCLLLIILQFIQNGCMAQYRPALFFREDWKEIPAATPVTQEHVSNKNLTIKTLRTWL